MTDPHLDPGGDAPLGSTRYVVDVLRALEAQLFEELSDLRRYRGRQSLGQLVARVVGEFMSERTAARAYGGAPGGLSPAAGDWLQFAAASIELVAVLRGDGTLDAEDDAVRGAFREAIDHALRDAVFGDTGRSALERPAPPRRPRSFRGPYAGGRLVDELASREAGGERRAAAEPFLHVAGDALAGVYVLMVQERAERDAAFGEAYRLAVTPPPAPPPELDLLMGRDEDTLIFAPRAQVEDVRAVRAALSRCTTWGDACDRLPPARLGELHDVLFGGKDPTRTPRATTLDRTALRGWPRLYYSSIPSWLPGAVIEAHGESYATMMDSGVTFDVAVADDVVAHLQRLGVRVERDRHLDDVFTDSAA